MPRRRASFGVDTGGTFTDVVKMGHDGSITVRKVDNAQTLIEANILRGILDLNPGLPAGTAEASRIIHCTTVLGNAIIQLKGPKTALITTRGFRDVLELRRQHNPILYEVFWAKPAALVPRRLCLEITERIGADGSVVAPLDLDEARQVFGNIQNQGVASVAICLINSCVNAAHERMLAKLGAEEFPSLSLSISSDISPEWSEYERTSTTVANAFVKPIFREYLESLERTLNEGGVVTPIDVMQSSGGVLPALLAQERPVYCIDSGPAAGAMATCAFSGVMGVRNAVTLEIGGTTAKSTLIREGKPQQKSETEFGAPVGPDGRTLKGAGYALRIPVIDIAEVGAGGGSIAIVDSGGSLSVGPEGAGALPGPVCYGRGGTKVTLTDANLVLGYLNEQQLLGGEIRLDRESAASAVEEQIAKPLGLSVQEAAYAVRSVANATMARAIRSISSERGRDVRKLTLFASGGGGPMHAAEIAGMLGMKRVVVPPVPGLFNALGLLWSPLEYNFAQAVRVELDNPSALRQMNRSISLLRSRVLGMPGIDGARLQLQFSADLHYAGQFHSLTVPFAREKKMSNQLIERLRRDFELEHRQTFGYVSETEPIILDTMRVAARPARANSRQRLAQKGLQNLISSLYPKREKSTEWPIAFGKRARRINVPVVSRADIGNKPASGPLIFPEYDTTVVVPPGFRVRRSNHACLFMEAP